MKGYDIFISYRRSGGEYTAKILKDRLEDLGYKVFFDVESLRSGDFNTKLYSVIEECKDFLLILSPEGLERCENQNDWLRLEITHALKNGLNIIPVMLRDFEFPAVLPQDIEPVRYKNGIEANSEFFDAFIEKLTKNFLKSKTNIFNRVTQNLLFKRTVPVLLSLVAIFGVMAGGLAIYNSTSKVYPKSRAEKNLTDEVVQYLQKNLASADTITADMNTAYRLCGSYLIHNDSLTYQEAVSAVDTAYSKLNTLEITKNAIDDKLSSSLDNSPFSKADAKDLNNSLDEMRKEMLNSLLFIKSTISPETKLDITVKQRLIELNQQSVELFANNMVYSTNSLLLPVSDAYIFDFKQTFLTELTNLPFSKYTWQKSEDELKRLSETDTNKYKAIVNELSTLVGNQNVGLMKDKSELIDYAVSIGLSKADAEKYVADLLTKSDNITALKKSLNEKQTQIESIKNEAKTKFAPLPSDDAAMLWGKMLRFLNLSLYDDAIKCAQAYGLKVNATDDNANTYMPIVIQFIKQISNTGIDYGIIIMGYEPNKPKHELYKIGDIIVGLNGQPCRNIVDYEKLKKPDGNVVSLMRLNEQGKFVITNYNVPTSQSRVLLYDLTEKE